MQKFTIPESVLASAGEVGTLLRSFDWSTTALGSIETWSQSLKTVVTLCFTSRFPMIILWGKDLIQIYNDGYQQILGTKHPQAMGQPTQECWSEVWHINEPIYQAVFDHGQVTYLENQLYPIRRNGYLEESYFTLCYSPIYGEDAISGVLVTVLETTQQVIGQRRLQTLQELGVQTAHAQTVQAVCNATFQTLANNTADFPFALLYLLNADRRTANLVGTVGIEPSTTNPERNPDEIDISQVIYLDQSLNQSSIPWSLVTVMQTEKAQVVDLEPQFSSLFDGAKARLPRSAFVFPLSQARQNSLLGVIVIGINAQRELDDPYRDFLTSVAGQISSALTAAQALETERQKNQIALQEGEVRLRQLAEAISSVFWLFDPYSRQLLYISPAYEQIWGRSCQDLYTDFGGWLDSIHPDHHAQVKSATARCLASGSVEEEYRIIHSNGSIRWIRDRGFVVRDASGQPYRVAGVAEDITDQVALKAERDQMLDREQAARAEAERANRIKDEFLAVLSHEIRTPLNPILGWSKMLQSGKLNPERATTALAAIERNARLQVQLIDDLLDVSRILQGKLSLNSSSLDLSQVISTALETIRLAADAKALNVQVDVALDRYFVLGDATRLQQVVWNLVSNAVKFTPEGGNIQIRVTQVENQAHLQVKDSGKGIHPDFLPHVFDYFRQEDGSTTRRFGGLGLGLAIVRQIVELHGGTIAVDSPGEGKGATFTAKFPLIKSTLPADAQLADVGSAHTLLPLEGVRILVVDDEPDSRDLIAFVVQQAGAKVASVSCVREALQTFQAVRPHVLLSDIGMPELDGYTLIGEINAMMMQKCLAIALTAYASDIDQQHALSSGFQKHLAKPVDPATLVETITGLMRDRGLDES